MIDLIKKTFTFLKTFVTYRMVTLYLMFNIVFTSVGSISLLVILPDIVFDEVWIGHCVMYMTYAMLLMNMAVFLLMKFGMLTGVVEIKV